MGWKPVNSTAIDIKKDKGNPHIGTLLGSDEITTKIGKQVIWRFRDDEEQPFGIYGFTNLNRALNSVKVGSLCRITYTGTLNLQTKFGMKDVHQVLVEVDDGQREDAAEGEKQDIPF